MEFKSPYFLLFIPLLFASFYLWRKRVREASFQFPSLTIVEGAPAGWRWKFYRLPQYLRWFVLLLLIIALSAPRKVLDQTVATSQGIDIVLSLDVSGSMAAEDYIVNGHRVSRVDIIKSVAKDFIDRRISDRIGLVVFGSQAYTVCPLTTDYQWLKENLSRLKIGVIEGNTAIGSGIAQSLLRLRNSKAKSKVIILMTDGGNNAGRIDPLTAGRMAKALGIKVYTIGAGSNGMAPIPVEMFGQTVYQTIPVDLEEGPLKQIASMTGARYFRASDTQALKQAYKDIDALEKTRIQTRGYRQYRESFWIFVIAALGLLAADIILANSLFLKIP